MAKDFDHSTWHQDEAFLKSLLRIKPTRRLSYARMAVHHHRLLAHFFALAQSHDGVGPWGSLFGSDIEAVTTRLMRVIELRIPYWRSDTDTSHGLPSEIFRRREHLKDHTRNWEALPKGVSTSRLELVFRGYLSNLYFDLDDHQALREPGAEARAPLEVLLSRDRLLPLAMLFIEFGAETQGIPKHKYISKQGKDIGAGDFDGFASIRMGNDPDAPRRLLALQMLGAIARATAARPHSESLEDRRAAEPSPDFNPPPPPKARPRRASL